MTTPTSSAVGFNRTGSTTIYVNNVPLTCDDAGIVLGVDPGFYDPDLAAEAITEEMSALWLKE